MASDGERPTRENGRFCANEIRDSADRSSHGGSLRLLWWLRGKQSTFPPFSDDVYKRLDRLKPIPDFWHPARRDFIGRTFILYYWLSSGDLQFKILIREAVQEG
jgi:hypothetical protein